jgi:hypothetical protein
MRLVPSVQSPGSNTAHEDKHFLPHDTRYAAMGVPTSGMIWSRRGPFDTIPTSASR